MKSSNPTLDHIAALCLENAEGEWQTAALAMRVEIDSNLELREELLAPLISGAIWDRIRKAARNDRRKCLQPNVGEDNTDGLKAMARRTLLDFPLREGTRLGDATRPEVAEAADWYGVLAKTNGTNATWLKSVARALPDDEKTVSDVLSEDQARRLRTKAEKGSTR